MVEVERDHDAVRRAHGFHHLRVARVVQETSDTRSYVLEPPEDGRDLFATYQSGQFCTFRATIAGEELLRCYSMSSSPALEEPLTVTVKRVPDGRFSGWLHDEVAEGDVLEATRPAGAFCTSADDDRPVVAFAGGSGITPVISIAKTVLATTERPVRLLYANRDAEHVIFADELDELSRRHPARLEVRHHLDADGGYLEAATIAGFVGEDLGADLFLCGPTPFMDLAEGTLLDLGVSPDDISIERFANAGQSLPTDTATVDDGVQAAEATTTGESTTTEVTVILKGKRHTIAYRPGDSLLDTARRGGLSTPFSCEAGECATCMAFVKEGEARMRINNALDDDEVEEGWVLTCQALPLSPTLVVEYESL